MKKYPIICRGIRRDFPIPPRGLVASTYNEEALLAEFSADDQEGLIEELFALTEELLSNNSNEPEGKTGSAETKCSCQENKH